MFAGMYSDTRLQRSSRGMVKTVQESLRHADSKVALDTYTQGLMPVKREATTQGYCDDWTHVDPRNFRKCLIAKVGRVAQLVEQCPFNP